MCVCGRERENNMMEIDARGLSLYVDTAKKTPTPSCTNRGNFYLIYFLLQKLGSVGLLACLLARLRGKHSSTPSCSFSLSTSFAVFFISKLFIGLRKIFYVLQMLIYFSNSVKVKLKQSSHSL